MKKIIVIGCPGSGKSTFSKALREITGIPLYHLDMLFWNGDKTTVEKSVFLGRLMEILPKSQWIIDGNYASTMEQRLTFCDTVIFLDYPAELCLQGVRERKGKRRSDMPWVESGEDDPEFIRFIENYNTQSRPKVMELLADCSDKDVFIFRNREEAEIFLTQMRQAFRKRC